MQNTIKLLITTALLGMTSLAAHASLETAVGLSTPVGATASLSTGGWVTSTLTTSAGAADDLADGGFSGSEFLRTGNGASNTLTLTLSNLGQHSALSLSFFVAQLGTLDPNRDGDLFTVQVDGLEVLQVGLGFGSAPGYYEDVVSNFELNGVAADTALVDAARTLTKTGNLTHSGFLEHVYDFGQLEALQNIEHTANSATITITGRAFQGWNNEAYALDNLGVGLVSAPIGSPLALLLVGLLGILAKRHSKQA
ncbi:MAG: hypothetical protein ACPG4N_01870 [Gammaproteobacteria bacterium]